MVGLLQLTRSGIRIKTEVVHLDRKHCYEHQDHPDYANSIHLQATDNHNKVQAWNIQCIDKYSSIAIFIKRNY